MWPTVTPDDVADLWRPLNDDETAVATKRIPLVEAELRRELRLRGVAGTPTVGNPGYPDAASVTEWETMYTGVVAQAVKMSLVNPDGWSEETEQIDDYQLTRRRDKSISGGLAYLADGDVEKLLPPIRPSRGSFSIRLS